MKKIIVVIVISFLLAPGFSQIVAIPDTVFLAALIEEGIDTNKDGQISYIEAEAVSSLSVNHKFGNSSSITDLTGIEAFVNVNTLSCRNNDLSSLDISNNTALKYLDCGNNALSNLDVSHNTALTDLRCWNNEISSLDVSNNTALRFLYCSDNQLTSLDISKNTVLEYLVYAGNQITNLDVSNNTLLTSLSGQTMKFAAAKTNLKRNAVYTTFSALIAGMMNVHYDFLIAETPRRFFKSQWIGFGAGKYYEVLASNGLNINAYYAGLTGMKNNHFEFNLGFAYFEEPDYNIPLGPLIMIGYRYQKPKGIGIFRTGVGWPQNVYLSLGVGF